MCGIIGIISENAVADRIIQGLTRLEYRGYDSAGVATAHHSALTRVRASGKLEALQQKLRQTPLNGTTGIGHTRWATHGFATEANAHPHMTDKVAVVHNGIIENHAFLRDGLVKAGVTFASQTDSEVIPHLITQKLERGATPLAAVQQTLAELEGAFALGIIFADHPDILIGARRGSPLVVGIGTGEMFLGSDAMALSHLTHDIMYLEDDDVAVLTRTTHDIYDAEKTPVTRPVRHIPISNAGAEKGEYPHFMLKEIFEQPQVVADTLARYTHATEGRVDLPPLPFSLADVSKVTIIACGTSYYAGLTARYWIQELARVPVEVDIASEYRYRAPAPVAGELFLCISQSGETADTLAALRLAKAQGLKSLAIVNVDHSSMAREADGALLTHAGAEIGVASTKAFTTQLVTLACFAIALADAKGTVALIEKRRLLHALGDAPAAMAEMLHASTALATLAETLAPARDVLYIGRGTSFPIAMEGALKLKEISYIHAEGYAAGELKHGPIALIAPEVPVVVIAPADTVLAKTLSNVQEVAARGGNIILLADDVGIQAARGMDIQTFRMPRVDAFIAPIVYAVPVQLLAYYTALAKGTDVDKPRNLAKSVTVE